MYNKQPTLTIEKERLTHAGWKIQTKQQKSIGKLEKRRKRKKHEGNEDIRRSYWPIIVLYYVLSSLR